MIGSSQARRGLLTLVIFLAGCLSLTTAAAAEEDRKVAQILFEQPFDPEKIPVLFIHGLFSSPETWEPMVSAFRANPEIREGYQFWFYSYPTDVSIVDSSARLRNQLDELIDNIESDYQLSMDRKITVIGHSMGGILAKSLISQSDDNYGIPHSMTL